MKSKLEPGLYHIRNEGVAELVDLSKEGIWEGFVWDTTPGLDDSTPYAAQWEEAPSSRKLKKDSLAVCIYAEDDREIDEINANDLMRRCDTNSVATEVLRIHKRHLAQEKNEKKEKAKLHPMAKKLGFYVYSDDGDYGIENPVNGASEYIDAGNFNRETAWTALIRIESEISEEIRAVRNNLKYLIRQRRKFCRAISNTQIEKLWLEK